MIGTVADLVHAVHEKTNLTKTYVQQRARILQVAGRLQVALGSNRPAAKPRDLVNLMFALASDTVRAAPQLVTDFESLQRLGECDPTERRAGDFLEKMIARAWAGHPRDMAKVIILWRHPFVQVDISDWLNPTLRYHAEGRLMEHPYHVRDGLQIPCTVISHIGQDIGHKGYSDAA